MAKVTVENGVVFIGGTDYSAQVSQATLELTVDAQDTTNFTSTNWKEHIGGLKSAQVSINFKKDNDLSGLDAAMWTALGTSVAIRLRLDDAAISTTNPEYQFNAIVTQWTPVAGSVGELFTGSVTWPVTGSITRDTTP